MNSIFDLALANLTSPMILFFVLGVLAALARSDLRVPDAIAKGLSLYLMLAIGFKGGAGAAAHGLNSQLVLALLAGIALSALMPLIAFQILRLTTNVNRIDAAAIAAHYGSISIVTFLAAIEVLNSVGIAHEGFMVAVAAVMEMPAIFAALLLANQNGKSMSHDTLREVLFNGSIVLLVGAFLIGWITGEEGLQSISAFIIDPFKGILCLFLLDMGLLAGRGLLDGRENLRWPLVAFGIFMPLIGAGLGLLAASLVGLSQGGTLLMMTLAASASYIAVPAAMRLALPDAKPSLYIPLSLGVTFPFNLTLGIPLYLHLSGLLF